MIIKSLFNYLTMDVNRLYKLCDDGDQSSILNIIQSSIYFSNLGLRYVFSKGNFDMIKFIIENGSNYQEDCLNYAIEYGNIDIIKIMTNKQWFSWTYVFYSSCLIGNIDIVKIAISNSDIISYNAGLNYACRGGHMDIINFLIEYGVNDWDSGLVGACEGGYINIVKFMLEKGADNFNEAFHKACDNEHIDIMVLFLQLGVQLKYGTRIDKTKLEYLIKKFPYINYKGFQKTVDRLKSRDNECCIILSRYILKDLGNIVNKY